MQAFLHRFLSQQRGTALIEFAIVLPVLLVLFFGAMEVTRLTLAVMRMQKSAYVLTDIISQSTPATYHRSSGEITEGSVREALSQLKQIVGGDDKDRVMIITHVQRIGTGGTVVRWQQSGGGTLSEGVVSVTGGGPCGSCYGSGMQAISIPGKDLGSMLPDESMLIGETFYYYQPMMSDLLSRLGFNFKPRVLHKTMFMMPRNGPLVCLPEAFIYTECLPPPPPPPPPEDEDEDGEDDGEDDGTTDPDSGAGGTDGGEG